MGVQNTAGKGGGQTIGQNIAGKGESELMSRCCEHGSEPSCSIKGGEFLE